MNDPSSQSRTDALQALFDEASILPAHERDAFLTARCANDPAMRADLESLLAADQRAGEFFAEPTIESNQVATSTEQAPQRQIGPYKLLQTIGEGGFGTVYLAEQQHPVRRRVALKVIKLGMDTRQVIARFEAERQALAMMDHPHIAKVFDAGATESGSPYFVMELVNGIPITEYCDKNNLSITSRMELFAQVCQAVQHAHQKGLIHRDIKPTNILVTTQDDRAVPKVIDFGIAKATQSRLTEKTLFTEFRQLIGTPEYMSPEQAESSLDIDTRSDVYSLGVLLYELLTGTTPFTSIELRSKAYAEIQRIIREVEPQKPSTRLSQSIDTIAGVAAHRHTEPAKLGSMVRGELDWIAMRCLEKDRSRRYETANGLAMDVQRHLSGEAVLAAPPSARYRFGKLARRNKRTLVTASLVVLALLAGTAVATWQAIVATGAKRDAIAAAVAEKAAKENAQAREAETRAVLEFVEKKVFAAARPEGQDGGLGREVTLRKAIEAAVPFVEASFTNQPLIEARLRMTLGASFWHLGEAKSAGDQFQIARTLYTSQSGPEDPATLVSIFNLGNSYYALGQYADALKLYEQTLVLQKAKLGPDHRDTLKCMNSLAATYGALGRHGDAAKLHEETLRLRKAKLGPDHPDTLTSMNNLAISLYAVGRYAEALKIYEEALPLARAQFGSNHPIILAVMSNMANSQSALGRHGNALKLREETLALQSATIGPNHPDTLNTMDGLAVSYANVGRLSDALKLREETLALRKIKLGPHHPDTLTSMNNLALSYNGLGRYQDALKLGAETLALRKAKLGPDHPDTLWSMWGVAESLVKLDRGAEGVPIIDECVRLASGKDVPPRLIADVMDLRIWHFQKISDAAGCLQTANMWEALKRTDAHSLYQSAYFRAMSATVMKETDKTPAGHAKTKEQADQAMAWLKQAVAAGYKNADHMKVDKNLDALRDRDDFKKLFAEVQAAP